MDKHSEQEKNRFEVSCTETGNQELTAAKKKTSNAKVQNLTISAMLTALVIVLQLLGSAIHFGVFSINLAMVPIVVGAALLGAPYGAWLGLVNAVVILLSGDAALFLAVNIPGTILTVILKGVLAGFCAGLIYRLISGKNKYAAVILAALVCPTVNTGIFLIGCRVFFWGTISEWAAAAGYVSAGVYAILGLAGVNYLLELGTNIILAPAIARLLGFSQEKSVARMVYGALLTVVGTVFLVFALVFLGTKSEGAQIFASYRVADGLNPAQRYFLLALFSDLCRIVGIVLFSTGAARRKWERDQNHTSYVKSESEV